MKTDRINYNRIAQAQKFYTGRGYQNIETPWLVTAQAIRTTLPLGKTMMETIRGVLVGSPEQGFIQQMLDGSLKPGTYQSTAACFMDENEHESPYFYGSDEDNPWFQTLELIWYKPEDVRTAYERVLNDAMQCCFEISDATAFDLSQTDSGFDIRHKEVILGSYGIRQMGDHLWVYGTGLVEPRFTLAMHQSLESPLEATEGSVEPTIGIPELQNDPAVN